MSHFFNDAAPEEVGGIEKLRLEIENDILGSENYLCQLAFGQARRVRCLDPDRAQDYRIILESSQQYIGSAQKPATNSLAGWL